MLRVRGALPSDPFTGRMKAAGFMYGSQPNGGVDAPVGQLRFHRGLRNGTPGTISGLTYRLNNVPPRWFGSVMNGRNGSPPGRRSTPEITHPPARVLMPLFALLKKRRPRPIGISQIPVAAKLFLISKVDNARSCL